MMFNVDTVVNFERKCRVCSCDLLDISCAIAIFSGIGLEEKLHRYLYIKVRNFYANLHPLSIERQGKKKLFRHIEKQKKNKGDIQTERQTESTKTYIYYIVLVVDMYERSYT